MSHGFSLAVHGGAGVLHRDCMTREGEAAYHAALDRALRAGEVVLGADGSAFDAVTRAVCVLEDEALFNAGRGAVFTRDGQHEMDASIMDGCNRQAGAVAGIVGPRNPILAARGVLEGTEHVFMIGEGALTVARAVGLDFEDSDYFFTQKRWELLQETLKKLTEGAPDDDPARRHGTVGAVARDRNGHLAAATSTGGTTAKQPGRAGDSPVIGAGTYADDSTCAVSATGDGEAFLRLCVAHEVEARVRLTGASLERAAEDVIMTRLTGLNGTGGIIAVDQHGEITMPFNCERMYRGWSVEEYCRGMEIC